MGKALPMLMLLAASALAQAAGPCETLDALPRLRCEEREALAAPNPRALRYGGVLLVVSDKKIHPLFDWPGTPATPEAAFFYQAFDTRLNAHVLRYITAGNDSGGVDLIHQRTGQHLSSVGAAANFAPGGQYFVTVSDVARSRTSEIQIWRANPDGFVNVAKFYPQTWKPASAPHKWLDDNTLQIAQACAAQQPESSPANCGVMQIQRSGTAWKLSK